MTSAKYQGRDLIYEWGRAAYERLAEQSDKIDTKAISIFSFGSVIIGITATLVSDIEVGWKLVPFVLAVCSYMFLAWKTITAFAVQHIIVSENPSKLKEKYWELSEDEAKEKYWESIEKSHDYNLDKVLMKGKALRLAIPALAIETIALVIWLLLRSFS